MSYLMKIQESNGGARAPAIFEVSNLNENWTTYYSTWWKGKPLKLSAQSDKTNKWRLDYLSLFYDKTH